MVTWRDCRNGCCGHSAHHQVNYREVPQPELTSDGLMSAPASCGHKDAEARHRPATAQAARRTRVARQPLATYISNVAVRRIAATLSPLARVSVMPVQSVASGGPPSHSKLTCLAANLWEAPLHTRDLGMGYYAALSTALSILLWTAS
jgi:hypothetical protein